MSRITLKDVKKATKLFWDCKYKNTTYHFLQNKEISKDAIMVCIYRATPDLTVRTLYPIHKILKGQLVLESLAKDIAEKGELLTNIINWLSFKYNGSYLDWHKNACNKVLQVVKTYYKKNKTTPVSYGKAQKVVNMAMKTAYCLLCTEDENVYKKYAERFAPCHIPLDSYTLKWFKDRKIGKKLKTDNSLFVKSKCDDWSNLQSCDMVTTAGEKYYSYELIAQEIAYLFENSCDKEYGSAEEQYLNLTPLQAEFFIWAQAKQLEFIKNLTSSLKKFINNKQAYKNAGLNTQEKTMHLPKRNLLAVLKSLLVKKVLAVWKRVLVVKKKVLAVWKRVLVVKKKVLAKSLVHLAVLRSILPFSKLTKTNLLDQAERILTIA